MNEEIRYLVESYYDIQKLRIETYNRIVSYVMNNSQKLFENQYAHANKPSIIAELIVEGKIEYPDEIENIVWLHNNLYEIEKNLVKRLDEITKDHPLRLHFLDRIRGIGPVLAAALIGWLSPIERFPNISKLWAYCGLAPGQKRRKGEKVNYNPKLKSLMWKIATSFEKQPSEKSRYRRLYEYKKEYLMNRKDLKSALERGEKGAKLHIRLLALRFTVKRFLADLWVEWRKLEGLPITKPYAHEKLGHEEYEEWKPDN